ncbi:MAG: hypothetical protein GY801_49300 [bacterium]|nr:hypothetical protein [bacterium]
MDTDVQTLMKSIIKEKHISGQWPLSQLLTILDALMEYENVIEQKKTKMKNLIRLAVLFLLVSVPGMFAAEYYNMSWLIPVLVAIAGLSILVIIIAAILNARRQSKDLHDEYRTYLQPLLIHLQDDLKPGSPIAVDFHLSPLKQKQFSKGKGPKYTKGVYFKCYDHTYERILFALKLRLHDGNRLMISLNEFMVVTSRTKKSASGKYKTKYKIKKRLTTDLRVLVNPEKFSCKALPAEGEPRFYTKERNNIPIIGLRAKQSANSLNMNGMSLNHTGTLGHLMILYTYIQPKTSAAIQDTVPE